MRSFSPSPFVLAPRSDRITPSQRPAADIGVHTSVASRSRSRYSSGTSGVSSAVTSITRSSWSAWRAIGIDSTVTWAFSKTSRSIP
jgi:phage-related protein